MQRLFSLALVFAVACLVAPPLPASDPVSFRKDIAPVLLDQCTSCHGPKKAEGGYRVDSFVQFSKAGDSGILPLAIQSGEPSELVRRIMSEDHDERMPAQREALPKETIELFRRWESEGSKFDGADAQVAIFELVPDRVYPAAPGEYSSAVGILAVAFSPDGLQVISGGYHELIVWDAASTNLVRRIGNLQERITSLDWSHDQKHLAVAGGSPGKIGEVRIVDWESGKVIQSVGRASDIISTARFQPNGQRLATGNADGTVRWYDTSDWHLIRSLASHADNVADIRWSHDGLRLASASRDKTAKVFDVESGELVATYSTHAEPVTGICFNEGDKEVTSVGGDRKVHRWQIEGSKTLVQTPLPANATRLHVNGAKGWLAMTNHSVREFDLATTQLARQLDGHSDWVTSLAFHGPSNRLVSGGIRGELKLWKLEDGTPIQSWIAVPVTPPSQTN